MFRSRESRSRLASAGNSAVSGAERLLRFTASLGSITMRCASRVHGLVLVAGSVAAVNAAAIAPPTSQTEQPASNCQSSWLSTFGGGPGTNDLVESFVAFDDGSGPSLFVGGQFTGAGGAAANGIAKWNGTYWSALGSGMTAMSPSTASVRALAVFDDGHGSALYAGGVFATAGGVGTNSIAKWNGSSWSDVGGGMNSGSIVFALAVFDDGSGSALYAAGNFTTAGGVAASRVAKWNGTTWSPLGSGMNGDIRSLAVFDDGSGPAMYAGGSFTVAGGHGTNRIAEWNGSSWSNLGSGIGAGQGEVDALAVFDDGSGPALYAGGGFIYAGGAPANEIAKWNGSSWSTLGAGITAGGGVSSLTVFDDGSGSALYAGGGFTTVDSVSANHIAKWNGSSWSALGSGVVGAYPYDVGALAVFDDGSAPALYAGGSFTSAGGVAASHIAKWNGSSWSVLGNGLNNPVYALTVFDDGSGSALYAGGAFTSAGGVATNSIAKWNGSSWSALGVGMNGYVFALTVFDGGSGPALYAAGSFSTAGGIAVSGVAKWDGSSWSALGSGMDGGVFALMAFDDGSGPALYAGGHFTSANGIAANSIAKWNGSAWSPLGTGVEMLYTVRAFAVFDDGSGPALYAGGTFLTAGGVPASHIAKWDGSIWSPLASGTNDEVDALTVFDDGSGAALFAGGFFNIAGGVTVNRIAKWNGSSWTPLASGMQSFDSHVYVLTTFDDGGHLALYAGGTFTNASGVAANNIAKWNGSSWSAVGNGMNDAVDALHEWDDGQGPALYAAGVFSSCMDSGDGYIAKRGNLPGCGMPGSSLCEPGAGAVIACPCGNAPAGSGLGCNNSSNTGGAALAATGIARLSFDTVAFTTSGEKPTATSIVLQGTSTSSSGVVLGQGVLCASGGLKRLYVKNALGGSITAPSGTDLHVHARSAQLGDTIAPGTHRYYGVYYRDPNVLGGCPAASTFNITQQLDVVWAQ
jgi:hypothetical protein